MHFLLAAALLATQGPDDAFKMKLMSDGAMAKIGYYMPQRITLSDKKPEGVKKLPEGLASPLFGVIKIASASGKTYSVVLDEPEGKPASLFIDTNGDGDLTNDPPTKWEGRPMGKADGPKLTQYGGSGTLDLGTETEPYKASFGFYRFDKADPARGGFKDVLFYYRDYAVTGEVTLGGKTYNVLLNDNAASGDFRGAPLPADATDKDSSGVNFMIDVNGNGKFDQRGESFDIRRPFNIAGTTYEVADIAPNGLSLRIVKSSKKVAEIPLPPDHAVGKKITAFEAQTTDGKAVHFPSDYKGKVVMLDFWATWCGPCMGEVPELVEVYNKFHDKGFEVLGVSLDNKDSVQRLKPVTEEKGMKWQQVCDAQGWDAAIAKMYVIQSIPSAFLVDGDTGEIIAMGGQLRKPNLEKTVEQAISKKKGS